MTSLAYACASRECSTVALPDADVAGTDAPALEETSHPLARSTRESYVGCARRSVSSGLRTTAPLVSTRTWAVIRAVEKE
jgi:hypothetical protein